MTYKTDHITAVYDMVIMGFNHPPGHRAVEYVHTFWTKALRCRPVYNEYRLKNPFIEEVKQ